MKKLLVNVALLFTALNLAACSSNPFYDNPPTPGYPATYPAKNVQNEKVAGNTQGLSSESGGAPTKAGMDANDKSKMMRALDNAIGKPTYWVNENSGVSYGVTPTKKVTIDGNSLCREYETTASKGDKEHKSQGTACLGTDGAWHSK